MSESLREEPTANMTSYDIQFVASIMARVVEMNDVNASLHVSDWSTWLFAASYGIRKLCPYSGKKFLSNGKVSGGEKSTQKL